MRWSDTGGVSDRMPSQPKWYARSYVLIDEVGTGYTRTATGVNLPLLYPSAVQRDYVANFTFGGSRLAASPSFGTSDAPFINYNTTYDITDAVSKTWRSHTFKFGMYFQRSRKNQTSFGAFDGSYNFGDNSANPYDTNFGFANAALGVYNGAQLDVFTLVRPFFLLPSNPMVLIGLLVGALLAWMRVR